MQGRWHVLPELAAGGLWTTPTDLARFMIAVWRSYRGQPHALLSPGLAEEMGWVVGLPSPVMRGR